MKRSTSAKKKTNYYDCTIRAGYYSLSGFEVGQHTYAIAEKAGKNYALPCFGSFALAPNERGHTGVVYPAKLYTPWIIGSREEAPAMGARLSVALGMAQFSLFPKTDWLVEDWDAWWRQNPGQNGYSVSSWAGLIYGVQGVCHQACNRILWSSRLGAFTFTPVNWPPSLSASYWAYGFYGKAVDAALILAAALVVSALLGTKAKAYTTKTLQLARDVRRHHTAAALADYTKGEDRKHEVQEILEWLPPSKQLKTSKQMTRVLEIDREFNKLKLELDNDLVLTTTSSSHDEYASTVNTKFNDMIDKFRTVMPRESFNALFPHARDGASYQLIDRRQMPTNYKEHRDQAPE